MKRLLSAYATMLCLAGTATAADATGKYYILGDPGTMKCADLLKNNSESSGRDYGLWLAGYVTALNRTTPNTYNAIGGVTIDALLKTVAQNCSAKPDMMVEEATWAALQAVYPTRQVKAP